MGLSFGEILVLAILAMVVIGPKDLPRLLRTVGRFLGQARRAIADVKRETGLDDVLRGDFEDLARLADHIEDMGAPRPAPALPSSGEPAGFRLREYPTIGADSSALLPEDAAVYADAAAYGDDAASTSAPRVPTLLGTPGAPPPLGADKAAS